MLYDASVCVLIKTSMATALTCVFLELKVINSWYIGYCRI